MKKQEFKVVMLPTEKASIIHLWNNGIKETIETCELEYSNTRNTQHLYIISNDEIKEGDWFINELHQLFQCNGQIKPSIYSDGKIVATTDFSLRYNTNDLMRGEVQGKYPTGIFNIPTSFIQAYIKVYNEGNPITGVCLEMEEYRFTYETGTKYSASIKTRLDNTVIVHTAKLYTRDELIKHITDCVANITIGRYKSVPLWIEENL